MKKKDLYRLINEEISEFDFLGMDNVKNEDELNNHLKSKEFQTNLIKDMVTDLFNKDKFTKLSATYQNKDTDMYNDNEKIELEIDLTYKFNENNFDLIIFIDGDIDDDIMKYKDFNIKLFSKAGDKINIDWVEKNETLYTKLIETLVSPYLED